MRTFALTLCVTTLALLAHATIAAEKSDKKTAASAPAAEAEWLTSWDAAVEQSKKTGKPILADFTGSDWCGWCVKLKKEVFDTPEFKEWAGKNVILLELDFPRKKKQDDATKKQNKDLMSKYKIKGFPTILILTADGDTKGQTGYMDGGPKAWIANAQKLVDKAGKK